MAFIVQTWLSSYMLKTNHLRARLRKIGNELWNGKKAISSRKCVSPTMYAASNAVLCLWILQLYYYYSRVLVARTNSYRKTGEFSRSDIFVLDEHDLGLFWLRLQDPIEEIGLHVNRQLFGPSTTTLASSRKPSGFPLFISHMFMNAIYGLTSDQAVV